MGGYTVDGADFKQRLLALAAQARAEQVGFIDGLSAAARQAAGTPARWSAKDLVAHIATWWRTQGQRLALVAHGEQPESFIWSDEMNAAFFAANAGRSWDDVVDEAANAYNDWARTVASINAADLTEPTRILAMHGQPLWRLVLSNGYIHPRTHLAEHYVEGGDLAMATQIQESIAADLAALTPDAQGWALYNLACFYAKIARPDEALAHLARAFARDPGLRDEVSQDHDLDTLRALPAFQALLDI